MSETDTSNARAVAFERWANMFTAHKAFSHPSELHGVLCGRLAAGARINEEEWLAMVCEHMGLPQAATDESDELREFMASAYSQTLELLKATDMSFQPLLPDDDYAIEQRLENLHRPGVGNGDSLTDRTDLLPPESDQRQDIARLVALPFPGSHQSDLRLTFGQQLVDFGALSGKRR